MHTYALYVHLSSPVLNSDLLFVFSTFLAGGLHRSTLSPVYASDKELAASSCIKRVDLLKCVFQTELVIFLSCEGLGCITEVRTETCGCIFVYVSRESTYHRELK